MAAVTLTVKQSIFFIALAETFQHELTYCIKKMLIRWKIEKRNIVRRRELA